MDVKAIHAFLTTAYWSPGIPLEIVQRAIDNSLCFGAFDGAAQVAFARVVTDKTTFAYLGDVYVLEAYRGQGLSVRLIETVMKHPDLQGLRRFMLATRDAHSLYGKFGFTPLSSPPRFMEKHRPNAYLPAEKE
jgi:GNAT superfamily N-acetyltransferase